jgi:hypothetical protein
MKKSVIVLAACFLFFVSPAFGQNESDGHTIDPEVLQTVQPRNESYALICHPVRPNVIGDCYVVVEPVQLKLDGYQMRKPLVYANAYNYVEGHYLWRSRIMDLGFTGSEYRYYDYPQIRN